ncbi:unnamed protein product [Caretta caretta]
MDSGVAHICDHTVQFFTVSNSKLAKIVSFLPAKDAVKVWNDPMVELKQGTGPKEVIGLPAFVSRGIQSVSMCLAGPQERNIAEIQTFHEQHLGVCSCPLMRLAMEYPAKYATRKQV